MLALRHERQHRPGGFYVVVSFLHDLVKSLGGDERRKKASAAAALSKHSPLKLGAALSTGTELVAASDDAGGGEGRARASEDGPRKRETRDGWASDEVLQARYAQMVVLHTDTV